VAHLKSVKSNLDAPSEDFVHARLRKQLDL